MKSFNVEKIKAGKKTTTTRSEREFENIGIHVGQSAIVNFGSQQFTVTNRGLLTVQEAGGKEAMLKSEGYATVNDLLYQQTKDWINGKSKLYVYDIKPTQAPTADEFTLKTKIAELEQKKKTTGLGPVELATLSYLETQLGKIIKSQC